MNEIICPRCGQANLPHSLCCTHCTQPVRLVYSGAARKLFQTTDLVGGDNALQSRITLHMGIHQKTFLLKPETWLTIGRSDEDFGHKVDIDLLSYGALESGVSRQHACIYQTAFLVHIMDLRSTNGTWVNGERLRANEAVTLNDADTLQLGRLSIALSIKSTAALHS